MLHNFSAAGKKLRLWQRRGETYEHVLMKALGYAMFAPTYPTLEVETRVGLRYKPDLVARDDEGGFLFWGECGLNTIRKTVWLLKHSGTGKLVLFKIGFRVEPLIEQLRREIPEKYRLSGRLSLINFADNIVKLTGSKQIEKVPAEWFEKFEI